MTAPHGPSRQAPPLRRMLHEQDWQSLAFLHWRADPAVVAPLLPAGTRPDEFDGSTWVGLIPFRLANATAPGLPGLGPIPVVGTFPEVNVRLYSIDERGRHGVVFRSLESSSLGAVVAARVLFGLPYQWADMSITTDAHGVIRYRSIRRGEGGLGGGRGPASAVDVVPTGRDRSEDELAVFLTARWGLHIERRGRTLFIPNEHPPWRVETAELEHLDDELLAAAGLPGLAERMPDSVLFSPGVHTRFGRALR